MEKRKTAILLFRFLKPHHFPGLMAIFFTLSCVLGYAISVALNKVHYMFPYISNTGTTVPASCYFGFFLNLTSVCAIMTMFHQHRFLENHESLMIPTTSSSLSTNRYFHAINDVAFFVGMLSGLGVTIVANFQTSSVSLIHYIGAAMVFIVGGVYCWMQTYLAFVLYKKSNYRKMFILRLFLASFLTLSLIILVIGVLVAVQQIGHRATILHWTAQMKVCNYYFFIIIKFLKNSCNKRILFTICCLCRHVLITLHYIVVYSYISYFRSADDIYFSANLYLGHFFHS